MPDSEPRRCRAVSVLLCSVVAMSPSAYTGAISPTCCPHLFLPTYAQAHGKVKLLNATSQVPGPTAGGGVGVECCEYDQKPRALSNRELGSHQ